MALGNKIIDKFNNTPLHGLFVEEREDQYFDYAFRQPGFELGGVTLSNHKDIGKLGYHEKCYSHQTTFDKQPEPLENNKIYLDLEKHEYVLLGVDGKVHQAEFPSKLSGMVSRTPDDYKLETVSKLPNNNEVEKDVIYFDEKTRKIAIFDYRADQVRRISLPKEVREKYTETADNKEKLIVEHLISSGLILPKQSAKQTILADLNYYLILEDALRKGYIGEKYTNKGILSNLPNLLIEEIKQGIDVDQKNKQGQTALDLALQYAVKNADHISPHYLKTFRDAITILLRCSSKESVDNLSKESQYALETLEKNQQFREILEPIKQFKNDPKPFWEKGVEQGFQQANYQLGKELVDPLFKHVNRKDYQPNTIDEESNSEKFNSFLRGFEYIEQATEQLPFLASKENSEKADRGEEEKEEKVKKPTPPSLLDQLVGAVMTMRNTLIFRYFSTKWYIEEKYGFTESTQGNKQENTKLLDNLIRDTSIEIVEINKSQPTQENNQRPSLLKTILGKAVQLREDIKKNHSAEKDSHVSSTTRSNSPPPPRRNRPPKSEEVFDATNDRSSMFSKNQSSTPSPSPSPSPYPEKTPQDGSEDTPGPAK